MNRVRFSMRFAAARLALAACLTATLPTAAVANDVVLDWNTVLSQVITDNVALQNPGQASRTMAMVNLAIHDSLKLGSGGSGDSFYNYGGSLGSLGATADREVAAVQAAHTILSSIYGDQQATLDAQLGTSLGAFSDGAAKDDGVALGTAIGQSIIDRRANDGSDNDPGFTVTNAPGHWSPDPLNPTPAWGPTWGQVDTFSITSVTDFDPPAIPDLTSQQYADSYNEVKELGSVDSTARTAEQTEIGLFWAYDREGLGTPLRLFNEALREVSVQQGNTLDENAELFAKASVSAADAAIVAWYSKFERDFWRPINAIRDGDLDGNDDTEGDPSWVALGGPDGDTDNIVGFTPPFPTYLSGHATFGGAVFGALKEFYGTDDIEFTLTSEELAVIIADDDLRELYGLDENIDAEREFSSFTEAIAENGRSRVYLGIHFDFDDLEARIVGQDIASAVFTGAFVAVPEPTGLLMAAIAGLATVRRRRR